MHALAPRRRHMAQINIVPYIDVMLVLLLIFMIATPLMQQGVTIELPQAPAEPVEPEPHREPLVLEVDREGRLRLLRAGDFAQAVSERDLPDYVAARMRDSDGGVLYVRADAGLSYGAVVALMARLDRAGVGTLGLLTEPPEEAP